MVKTLMCFDPLSYGLGLIALTTIVNHANIASGLKVEAGIGFISHPLQYDYPDTQTKLVDNNFGIIDGFLPNEMYLGEERTMTEEDIKSALDPLPPDDHTIWNRFTAKIDFLNNHAPPNVQWKVLFFARHGQAVNNLVKIISNDWENDKLKETFMDPKSKRVYDLLDPDLTEGGVQDGEYAKKYWKDKHAMGLPVPHLFLVSPARRTLRTADITFSEKEFASQFGGIFSGYAKTDLKVPIIMEALREQKTLDSHNKINDHTTIDKYKDRFQLDEGFVLTEMDSDQKPESPSEFKTRSKEAIESILERAKDTATYIHLTTHSGFIRYAFKSFPPLAGYVKEMIDSIEQMLVELETGYEEVKLAESSGKNLNSEENLIKTKYETLKERMELLESGEGGGISSPWILPGDTTMVVLKVTY